MILVFNEDQNVGEYDSAYDSNIDGTLRIYVASVIVAEYEPGEWTHIELVSDDEPQGNAGWDYEQDG